MAWTGITNVFRSSDTNRSSRSGVIGRFALGEYELLKLIGEGSNGEVYLARPRKNPNDLVVVKRVKEQVLQSPRFAQFFDAEVHSMKRFAHPYVVQLIDAALDDPIGPCLVLEYINGVTLEALIRQYPRWYPERLGLLVGQLCHALQAAHDAGIMHRDMKPANLMVTGFNTPQETLKVMDFGFAGFTERPHIQIAELTGHGPVFACGTPAYVSPEMVRGDSVDGRADLYSVGVMLYEMLAGRLPFEYPSVQDIVSAHASQTPPRFNRINVTDVSPAVEGVVQLALGKFPSERHQSGRELAKHFGNAIGQEIWDSTVPEGYNPSDSAATQVLAGATTIVDIPQPSSAEAEYIFHDRFEAMLPHGLAGAKLKGFVEEIQGVVAESEPGIVKIWINTPKGWTGRPTQSGMFAWLSAIRSPTFRRGREPIEINLRMQKIDSNRVAVRVSFHPISQFMPDDLPVWRDRCEGVYGVLRMYLMAV